ncbi:GNAT family N-acetyltransferase [Candidatus Omnitrophota bacterium]
MLRITEIKDFDALEISESEWNAILSQSVINVPYLTYGWLRSWWESYNVDHELLLLVVKSGKDIIAIAPMMISRTRYCGIPVRKVEFLATPRSDYSDMIVAENYSGVLDIVLKHILAKKDQWDIIEFSEIREDSPLLNHSKHILSAYPCFYNVTKVEVSPMINIEDTFETYFKTCVSKKIRTHIKQYIRALSSDAKMEVEHYTDISENNKLLDDFFLMHNKRWRTKQKKCKFGEDARRNFNIKVADNFSKNKWFILSVLKLNAKPIAFHYGFIYTNKFFYSIPTFDCDLAKYSPGIILLRHLVEYAFNNGFKEFDFLRGGEEYKFGWANRAKFNYKLVIFKKNIFTKSFFLYLFYAFVELTKTARSNNHGLSNLRK